ncbi:MAG: hypothetical protein ACK5Y2_09300 [Bdellovibrionales bacterium]
MIQIRAFLAKGQRQSSSGEVFLAPEAEVSGDVGFGDFPVVKAFFTKVLIVTTGAMIESLRVFEGNKKGFKQIWYSG